MPTATLTLADCPVALIRRRDGGRGIDHAVRQGRLRRVAAGVYAPAAAWAALKPHQRYLARVHAYALVHPDAVFAFESAAVLCGLPVIGEPDEIHVLVPYAGAGAPRGRRAGARGRR